MMKEVWNKIIQHTVTEIQIPNIITSLSITDYDLLQKAHVSIHAFIYIASLCLPQGISWHSKSAFLIYHYVAYDQAHRSFIEALAGYYNTANIILRSVLELVTRGAFWECMAHKRFRENAEIIEKEAVVKLGNSKKSILDWMNEIIRLRPDVETELEQTSAGIFDKINPIFKNPKLERLVPKFRVILKQLSVWNILKPYHENDIYRIYKKLSQEVHVVPDKTDIGRRLLCKKDIFETEIIQKELEEYLRSLHKVMDVGIVIELNVLSDRISQLEDKTKLKERLLVLQNLELKSAFKRLLELIGHGN